jgi:hypothetical protein
MSWTFTRRPFITPTVGDGLLGMVYRNRNGRQGTVKKKMALLYASRESKPTGNRKVMSNELKPELSSAYH